MHFFHKWKYIQKPKDQWFEGIKYTAGSDEFRKCIVCDIYEMRYLDYEMYEGWKRLNADEIKIVKDKYEQNVVNVS